MLITSWEQFKTDYKRFKYFSIHDNLIQSIEYVIGFTTNESKKNNEVSLKSLLKNRTIIYISVKKTLKYFLKIPDIR